MIDIEHVDETSRAGNNTERDTYAGSILLGTV